MGFHFQFAEVKSFFSHGGGYGTPQVENLAGQKWLTSTAVACVEGRVIR